MTPEQIMDQIDEVVAYACTIWPEEAATEWFYGFNDYLDGARPIDCLLRGRIDDVMNALELEKA